MSVSTDGSIYAASNINDSTDPMMVNILLVKLTASGQKDWVLVLGGQLTTTIRTIKAIEDKGVLILGATTGYGQGSFDAVVGKISENGTVEWMKTLGGNLFDEVFEI